MRQHFRDPRGLAAEISAQDQLSARAEFEGA